MNLIEKYICKSCRTQIYQNLEKNFQKHGIIFNEKLSDEEVGEKAINDNCGDGLQPDPDYTDPAIDIEKKEKQRINYATKFSKNNDQLLEFMKKGRYKWC